MWRRRDSNSLKGDCPFRGLFAFCFESFSILTTVLSGIPDEKRYHYATPPISALLELSRTTLSGCSPLLLRHFLLFGLSVCCSPGRFHSYACPLCYFTPQGIPLNLLNLKSFPRWRIFPCPQGLSCFRHKMTEVKP